MSTFEKNRTLGDWSGVQGVTVSVTGNVDMNYSLSFGGEYGGADSLIRDFEFWNFTYAVPRNLTDAPHIELDFDMW